MSLLLRQELPIAVRAREADQPFGGYLSLQFAVDKGGASLPAHRKGRASVDEPAREVFGNVALAGTHSDRIFAPSLQAQALVARGTLERLLRCRRAFWHLSICRRWVQGVAVGPLMATSSSGTAPSCHSLVEPASIPVTNVRCAKKKMIKTGAIATSVAIASSGRRTGLLAPDATGLKAAVEEMR